MIWEKEEGLYYTTFYEMNNQSIEEKNGMSNYTTQMDAARKGIITPQMEAVAKEEYRSPEEI